MKLIGFFLAAILLMASQLYSQLPEVKPDNSFLPYLLDSTFQYYWDEENSEWQLETRCLYAFDEYGKIVKEEINGSLGMFVAGISEGEYTYDHEGKLIKVEKTGFRKSLKECCRGEIQFNYCEEYFYSSAGNLKKIEITENQKGPRSMDTRAVHSFDDLEKLTEIVGFVWDPQNNNWVINSKDYYSYDVNENLIESVSFGWQITHTSSSDGYASISKDDDSTKHRSVFTYDGNGNLIEEIHYSWNEYDNKEKEDWRNVNTYDAGGSLTEQVRYNWDMYAQDWTEGENTVYLYDSDGKLTEYTNYEWSSGLNDWEGQIRGFLHYDDNGNLHEQVDHNWDRDTQEWENCGLIKAFWTELAASSAHHSQDIFIHFYPNPVSTHLTIEAGNSASVEIQITSLNGQQLLHEETERSIHQIDLSSLRKGIYVITIRSEDYCFSRKIIRL